MSQHDSKGAVRPTAKKNRNREGIGAPIAASEKRTQDVEEAENRGNQSAVRLLFAFLIPVVLLIVYAMFGS
jgi:hypothetical protein